MCWRRRGAGRGGWRGPPLPSPAWDGRPASPSSAASYWPGARLVGRTGYRGALYPGQGTGH